MSAHTYWRINITANNTGSYLSIAEIEMRASLDGVDECNGGTVIYSTQADSGSNAATQAFNNDYVNDKWTSNGTSTGYIGYQFTTAVDIVQVAITGPISGQSTYAPKTFTIQYSDNATVWTTASSPVDQTGWGTLEQRIFTLYSYTLAGNITESLAITDWRLIASKCSDGKFAGASISTGSTYSIPINIALEPCIISISPKIDYMWSAAKTTAVNDYVVAVNPDTTPHLWKCTTAGATHATTEPTWNLSGTTTDNTTTWTYVAPLVDPVSLGPKIPS